MANINVSLNEEEAIDMIRAIDLLIPFEKDLGRFGKVERLISLQTTLQNELSNEVA